MYNQIEYKFKISIMEGSWRKYESKEETEGVDIGSMPNNWYFTNVCICTINIGMASAGTY